MSLVPALSKCLFSEIKSVSVELKSIMTFETKCLVMYSFFNFVTVSAAAALTVTEFVPVSI